MILRASVFAKLDTVKTSLDYSPKSAISEHAFTVNMWKRSKYLAYLHESTFSMFFHHYQCKLFWKISPLVLGEVLVVFVNRLTADGKYPVQDCENLQLPIQMQLSQKRKIFSIFGSISGIYIKFSTFSKRGLFS